MKKYIGMLLAIVMLLALLAGCGSGGPVERPNEGSAQADANDEYFLWYNDTVIEGLTEAGKKQKNLVIPAKCTMVSVLGDSGFESISFENQDTEIAACTFSDCTALKRVDLPDNLKVLDWAVFSGCINLEEIEIPIGVTKIDDEAFMGCSSLKRIVVNGNVEVVARGAFRDCTSLETITLPDSVVTIEKQAFKGCSALKDVSFGSSLNDVGESAFENCASLAVIKLPESVRVIDAYAFAYCDALEEVYLPGGLEMLESTALAQLHNFNLFLKTGSLADRMVGDMMGNEYMIKNYY